MDNPINNPDNWKFGIFYYNPGDKRLFLPKRNPALGYTLNFGNPYCYLIIAALTGSIWVVTWLADS